MQARGQLQRPLWDVIHSIGSHAHAQQTRRALRTQNIAGRGASDVRAPVGAGVARPGLRHDGARDGPEPGGTFELPIPLAPAQDTPGGVQDGGTIIANGRQTPAQPAPARSGLVRRLIDSKYDSECEAAEVGRGDGEGGEQNAEGAFDAVVQRATATGTDYNAFRWPAHKRDGELRLRYFHAYQNDRKHRLARQFKRWQIQRDRFGSQSARNWRTTLDLLDRATPDGDTRHRRRMEIVSLPDGVWATWKKDAGEVVLELMQRTGAHLQTLPSTPRGSTFNAVSLWGTPAQNEHALRTLPTLVEAANKAQGTVNVYELRSKVVHDSTATQDAFSDDAKDATDATYWREQEALDSGEMELLEDALGDITNAPSKEPAPLRAVWAPSNVAIRARPAQWNQLTFSAYVDALTVPIPRLAQRKLYGPQPPTDTRAHAETMAAELVRLFTDRYSRPFASASALDVAVRFFMKYHDFQSARKVFDSLEHRQFDFSASNYEVFFQVAAKEESVANFLYVLRLLIGKGMRPTATTWTAFHLLMAKRFPLESNLVTEAMRRKGFFANADTVKAVAACEVDRAIVGQLTSGNSVEDFLHGYEAKFGDPAVWLSSRFVNRMSRVLLERGRVDDACNAVRQFEATARERGRQGVRVDTLNTFLSSSLRDGNVESALAYLRLFVPPPSTAEDSDGPATLPIGRYADDAMAIQPDHVTFGILFGLAWSRRMYNVSRVIWRHACAAGHVTFKMQNTVGRSLTRETELRQPDDEAADVRSMKEWLASSLNDGILWGMLAGKFVVGVKAGLSNEREARSGPTIDGFMPFVVAGSGKAAEGPLPTDKLWDNASAALQVQPGGRHLTLGPRARFSIARDLIATDLGEAGSVKPANLLLHDLERAWRLDVLWKEEGLGKIYGLRKAQDEGKKPRQAHPNEVLQALLEEMVERGVTVPMTVGDAAGVREAAGLAEVRYQPFSV